MSEYNRKKVGERKFKDGKEVYINIERKDKGIIDPWSIFKLEDEVKQYDPNAKLRIRALGPTRWTTLKGYDTTLDILSYEDYFSGAVADTSKFNKFYKLQVTILR